MKGIALNDDLQRETDGTRARPSATPASVANEWALPLQRAQDKKASSPAWVKWEQGPMKEADKIVTKYATASYNEKGYFTGLWLNDGVDENGLFKLKSALETVTAARSQINRGHGATDDGHDKAIRVR